MRKVLSLLLGVLLIAALAVSAAADESGENAGTVPGTTEELVLDGIMDDAYQNGLCLEGITLGEGEPGDTPIKYYIVYTATDLWIFADVQDKTLKTELENELQPNYKMDSVEVMLDPENSGENMPDETPWQMRVDYLGNLSARLGKGGTSLYHSPALDGDVDFYEAVAVVVDGGFCAEYKIPMEDLTPGRAMGFNLCYNDWDEDGIDRVVYTTTPFVDSWYPESFDYFVLGEIAAPAPTYTYPASGAGDNIINGTVIGNETGWGDNAAAGAAAAFDGNPGTFFDPLGVGDGFCGIDAGESYILDKVAILSRDGFNDRFVGAMIQGSNDGENWTTLWTSDAQGTYPDYITVTEFENNTGYSQFRYFNETNHGDVAEVEFYGAPGKALPAVENYALGAKVTVTSTETDDFPGELAVDGDLSTRWASAYTDDEAITIDLGKPKAVNYMALYWETAMATDYEIYGSLDENDLQAKTLATVTGNAANDNVVEFDTEAVRYITIHSSKRATEWGNSLYEVVVSGEGDADVPEAPAADEKLDAKAEAPNTFDFGVIAAVAAVISLGGFAVTKKKH